MKFLAPALYLVSWTVSVTAFSAKEPPKAFPSVQEPPKVVPSVQEPPKVVPSVQEPPEVVRSEIDRSPEGLNPQFGFSPVRDRLRSHPNAPITLNNRKHVWLQQVR
jgi:hypothetical protein